MRALVAAVAVVGLGACAHRPPRQVTLLDFWATWCAACDEVAAKNEAQLAGDDRIVVKKIDVGDVTGPVAQRYEVGALPHWNVYDVHGRLRYRLIGSEALRAPQLARDLLAEP